MIRSAVHVCPVQGLAEIQPPHLGLVSRAAGLARNLRLRQIYLPVLESSLAWRPSRDVVRYLDGLIRVLDRLGEAKVEACLVPLTGRVMGLDCLPPYLVGPVEDEAAGPVLFQGRIKRLRPLEWWTQPALIQKKLRLLQELLGAVVGHPAVTDWLILDRAWPPSGPDPVTAELVLRSMAAEIKSRDERAGLVMGLSWADLREPQLMRGLAMRLDRLRLAGLEEMPQWIEHQGTLAEELLLVGYLGSLAVWLFNRPVEVEAGWGACQGPGPADQLDWVASRLAGLGFEGLSWVGLIDPDPREAAQPPWRLRPGLDRAALLTRAVEAKSWVESLCQHPIEPKAGGRALDFIDVSPEEYLAQPERHFVRLWRRYRDG